MLQLRHQNAIPLLLLLHPLIPLPVQLDILLGLLQHPLLQSGDNLGFLFELPISVLDHHLASARDLIKSHLHGLHLLLWMRGRMFFLNLSIPLGAELGVLLDEPIQAFLGTAELFFEILVPLEQLLASFHLLLLDQPHLLVHLLHLLLLLSRHIDVGLQLLLIRLLDSLELPVQLLNHLLKAFPHPVDVVAVGLLFGAEVMHKEIVALLLDLHLLLKRRVIHLGQFNFQALLLQLQLLDLRNVRNRDLLGLFFKILDLDAKPEHLGVVDFLSLVKLLLHLLLGFLEHGLQCTDLLLNQLCALLGCFELFLTLQTHRLHGLQGLT
mmetsp:Transcript_23593/g.54845  ORF Transcript_23593/g.54845 Transcript_23593/m.54845 type:complete len:324 (-) Transcript_23593:492-1463(-)